MASSKKNLLGKFLQFMAFAFRLLLFLLCILLAAVVVVAVFFGTTHWWFEVTTHFVHLYFLAAIALGLLALLARARISATICVLLLLCLLPSMAPYYLPQFGNAAAAGSNRELKIFHFNPRANNQSNYDGALALAAQSNADIIAISEINPQWERRLKKALPEYTQKLVTTEGGGIALLSKVPLTSLELRYFGERRRPRIFAVANIGGVPVRILAVHPFIPVGKALTRRNEEFKQWATDLSAGSGPVIVVGDMNSSPWSPYLREFMEAAKLRDTALGFGIAPTWPADVFAITPIDHCLVSDHFTVSHRNAGPAFGSDHLPITAVVRLK